MVRRNKEMTKNIGEEVKIGDETILKVSEDIYKQ